MRRMGLAGLVLLTSISACSQRDLATCDITQRACQESIYYRLVNLRGDGYDPFGGLPPVTVISEDQFRAMLEGEAAATHTQEGPSPWDKALVLLHFTASPAAASPDGGSDGGSSAIDDEVSHIYAFYDPPSRTITVIAHPDQSSDYAAEEAMLTLAHELVHALQDRELDLARLTDPDRFDFHSFDETMAYKAMIEGDARFYEYLFTEEVRRMLGMPPRDATAMASAELERAYGNFAELGSAYFATQYLMYPLGAQYLATAYRSGGNAAVRHAYAKVPTRTAGFLASAEGRPVPAAWGTPCPAPSPGLATLAMPAGEDHFGAVACYAFFRAWGVEHEAAFVAAQSWTGDSLRAEATADSRTTAVAWRFEFSVPPPSSIAQKLEAARELAVKIGPYSIEVTATDSPTPLYWTSSCR